MANNYKTLDGISIISGFALNSPAPMDSRTIVSNLAELDPDYIYTGLVVYVNSQDDTKGLYVYNGESWKPVATSTTTGDIEIPEVDLTGYATEQYVKDEIAKIDFPKTDLSDYALKTELFSKNYNDLTNKPTIPSIAGLATESYVNTAISNLSSSNHNHNDLYAPISHSHTYKPSFSKYISHGAGNPQAINFITVDYSTYTSSYAAYFKLDATSCHGNGVSYQFLEEIIIGVTSAGNISLAINKSCQQACGQVDGIERYFGDVFAVKDETNKKVYFYILGGQYCLSWYTDLTPIGSATTAGVTQHTSLTLYSSGDKIWAQGCGNTCHDYLPISGGNLTGALTVNGAGGIDTNGYVTSTWLKTTSATDLNKVASKVAVIDASGWIYYRTPAELMSDMGAASKTDVDSLIEISSDGKTLTINI